METLLVVAIVLTTLAVLTQAGILIAMYLMSRRVVDNVNGLVGESQTLMEPLHRVATNFKMASEDVVGMSKDAREEMYRIQNTLYETQTAVRDEIQDLRDRINDTADEIQSKVMTPIRNWSAVFSGINVGLRTFFAKEHKEEPVLEAEDTFIIIEDDRESPAA